MLFLNRRFPYRGSLFASDRTLRSIEMVAFGPNTFPRTSPSPTPPSASACRWDEAAESPSAEIESSLVVTESSPVTTTAFPALPMFTSVSGAASGVASFSSPTKKAYKSKPPPTANRTTQPRPTRQGNYIDGSSNPTEPYPVSQHAGNASWSRGGMAWSLLSAGNRYLMDGASQTRRRLHYGDSQRLRAPETTRGPERIIHAPFRRSLSGVDRIRTYCLRFVDCL